MKLREGGQKIYCHKPGGWER